MYRNTNNMYILTTQYINYTQYTYTHTYMLSLADLNLLDLCWFIFALGACNGIGHIIFNYVFN